MSSDLVKRLRETKEDWPANLVYLEQEAADRIEALEAEVNELKNWKQDFEPELAKAEAEAEKWRTDHHAQSKLLRAAEARAERLQVECAENEKLWNEASNLAELNGEVADSAMKRAERLRVALAEVMEWLKNWEPSFMQDGEWAATELQARKALEDDKQ